MPRTELDTLVRCRYCGMPSDTARPDRPGQYGVCAGCGGINRVRPDGLYERTDLSELCDRHRELLLGLVDRVNAYHAENGGGLPGYRWRAATLCRTCWDDWEPGREPVVLRGAPIEPCAFCGSLTTDGIYRQALLEEEPRTVN